MRNAASTMPDIADAKIVASNHRWTVRHAYSTRADRRRGSYCLTVGADFSMRNRTSRSPRSIASIRSPVSVTRCGMSMAASGSVQRTSSRSPGAKDFKALRVFSAGSGHFSPDRSNLVIVMSRHARIIRASSIAKRARYIPLERNDVRGGARG
jgi:hypothetical protein